MHIVLISGKAEHGKTSVANAIKDILKEEFGQEVLISGFARYLKFIAREYFGWNGVKDEAGRALLQRLGTDIVRQRYPDFWVKALFDFARVFGRDFPYMLVDDVRFINEVKYFGERGILPYTIRVHRPNYENHLTAEQRMHRSETELDDYPFDVYISNPEGLDNLRTEVIKTLFMEQTNVFPLWSERSV